MRQTHGYCPECREESAVDPAGRCLWCGGPTEQRAKRGGWKRPDLRGSRYTEAQLRALHVAHMQGASVNGLAKQTYERVGYRTHSSAAVAISREWKRMGLPVRDRIEQVKLTCTVHGMAPKHGPRPGYQTYKRRVLRAQVDRPACKGIRQQPPRRGDPCDRPSMEGSDYCFNHDPARRAEVESIVARMWDRQPEKPMVPMEPFAAWLRRQHDLLGTWTAVAEELGAHTTSVHNYARGLGSDKQPKAEIGEDTARRYMGSDFDRIYPEPDGVWSREAA